MNPARIFFLATLLAAHAAIAGTSANYTLAPDTVDSGGLRGSSAVYTIDRSFTPGGSGSSTSYALTTGFAGQLIDSTTTPLVQPEIVVEQPSGVNIVDNGSLSFGTVTLGAGGLQTFTIRNTGTAPLTGLGITINGADAAMFSLASSPVAPVSPGGSTTFSIRFTPASSGSKTAALHIANNDSDENPFDINLTGTGSAIVVDLDINSFRFTGPGGRDVEVKFNTVSGAAYRLLISPDMAPGSWTDSGIPIPGNGSEQTVVVPDIGLSQRLFFRLVTL